MPPDSLNLPAEVSRGWRDYVVLALSFFPAAVLTWGIHEYAHYFTGVCLGYDMWISFNQVGLIEGSYRHQIHEFAVSMSGPLVTWLQAMVAYFCLRWCRELWLYPVLFLPFWSRALAMIISFISHPNDEARASLLIGLPMWILPAVSVGLMFGFTFLASRRLRVGWIGNTIAYVSASLVTTIVVFSDQWLFSN